MLLSLSAERARLCGEKRLSLLSLCHACVSVPSLSTLVCVTHTN